MSTVIFELATALTVFSAATDTKSPWITAVLIVSGVANLTVGIMKLIRLKRRGVKTSHFVCAN